MPEPGNPGAARAGGPGKRPAAFIDRDGVINAEHGYVHRAEDFMLLPGAVAGLRQLAAAGFALVVVTNQSGIARGKYSEADFFALTTHMHGVLKAQGVVLDGVYHCPHHPDGRVAAYAVACHCRKPAPGLLLQATADLGLDLSRSALVGDKVSDCEAGRAAGVHWTVLVESGHALPDGPIATVDHRCTDLSAAASWLVSRHPPDTAPATA